MSLAALLIASLSLVASVSLIIVFCVLWLRSPVEMETDQTSQTQRPDNVTEDPKRDQTPMSQTPRPDNPTSKTRTDQKQLQAKTKAEYDAYNAIVHEPDPKKRIELANKFINEHPESEFKDYLIQIASPSDRPGASGPVFRVGEEDVKAPSILYRVEPTYSNEGNKAKIQGVVVLSAIVRKDGGIEIVKVARGLGYGLDENAIAALKQWKFRPGTKNGVPVDVALNVEVNFSLR